ncbi:MAG: HAMP domain-containing sensor histidine kinase [Gemmatimonadota bacterium]
MAASSVAERLRAQTPDILDNWLERLGSPTASEPRSESLLEAYRDFGAALVERVAVEFAGQPSPADLESRLSHALAQVAGQSRKSDLAMWQALANVNLLLPAILAELPVGDGAPEDSSGIVCDVVGTASVTLSRVLEASEIRIRRERSETVSSMTEILVHELHNRLGAADTASRMLVNPSPPIDEEWLARIARLIRGSLEDAMRTIKDVRNVVASRDHVETADLRPMALPLLVRDVVRELEPRATANGVRLKVPERLPGVKVDASRIRLILTNLVGNAIKYRDPDEQESRVSITGRMEDDGRVTLNVRDNGIGIAADEVDEIFLHRFRGDHVRDIEGTGLGLAIACEAADQLGATITVESEIGVGTSFSVSVRPLPDRQQESNA